MSKTSKRILVISDTHSGHECGLADPSWHYKYVKSPKEDFIRRRNKIAILQSEMWNWYEKTVESLKPIDILFHLGDAIEGTAEKNAGNELITTDVNKQCQMAADCINIAKAKEIIMVYGTGYHAGNTVDNEDIVAEKVGASKIGSHEWVSFYDGKIVFDLKHHVGSSSVPYSRGTAVSKEKLWNTLWAEKQMQPNSNIILRGHTHYEYYTGNADWLAMTVPGLQWNTKYGVRRCTGTVNIGLTVFDVCPDGTYSWTYKIAKLNHQKVNPISL